MRVTIELGSIRPLKAGLAATILLLLGCQPGEVEPLGESAIAAQRIVSLSPHITELVFAAGAGDKLAGVVDFSDHPPDATSVRRIGDSFRVDYEAINSLQPDLILAWGTGNPVELIDRLRTLNYRVVALETRSLDDIPAQIETIGELAGTSTAAALSAGEFREQLARLRAQYSGESDLRVFYQIASQPYFTVTEKHVISEAIGLCGGRNIFANIPGLAPAVSKEAIIALDPEVILAAVSPENTSWRESWSDWASVNAVARNNLFAINRDLMSRPGPRIVQGVRQICDALVEARNKP